MSYSRINWVDYPSITTPINADNLNKMDKGILDLDTTITGMKNGVNAKKGNMLYSYDGTTAPPASSSVYTSITLSDTASNYDIFDIFANVREGPPTSFSTRVIYPQSKHVLLTAHNANVTETNLKVWLKIAQIKIENKNITFEYNMHYNITNSTVSGAHDNFIYITNVVGYNHVFTRV